MWTNWTFPLQDFFFHQAYTGCSNISDEGKIIMNGQDLVRYASQARVKFPKHISLAISAKHLTGSKQLITVLNKMVTTVRRTNKLRSWTPVFQRRYLQNQKKRWVTIPSNIFPCIFVKMAGNSNKLNQTNYWRKEYYSRNRTAYKMRPIACTSSPCWPF